MSKLMPMIMPQELRKNNKSKSKDLVDWHLARAEYFMTWAVRFAIIAVISALIAVIAQFL